ncbi:hypothetical protein [Porphyromonas endodontalis]|uniref:hypothetical protein n=1 Tax=Porphyromonas endodontalis TaxID=28124 RepID=UPI0028D80E8A|nr:hypothetical protein [Porphyromonas endodontalis]
MNECPIILAMFLIGTPSSKVSVSKQCRSLYFNTYLLLYLFEHSVISFQKDDSKKYFTLTDVTYEQTTVRPKKA